MPGQHGRRGNTLHHFLRLKADDTATRGGDTFVMGATVTKAELIKALQPVAAGEPL